MNKLPPWDELEPMLKTHSQAEIARLFDVTRSAVSAAVSRKTPKRIEPLNPPAVEFTKRWMRGDSLKSIADHFGMSVSSASNYARRYGCPPRHVFERIGNG